MGTTNYSYTSTGTAVIDALGNPVTHTVGYGYATSGWQDALGQVTTVLRSNSIESGRQDPPERSSRLIMTRSGTPSPARTRLAEPPRSSGTRTTTRRRSSMPMARSRRLSMATRQQLRHHRRQAEGPGQSRSTWQPNFLFLQCSRTKSSPKPIRSGNITSYGYDTYRKQDNQDEPAQQHLDICLRPGR